MPPVKAYRTIEFLPSASARTLRILAEDLDLFHRADTPQVPQIFKKSLAINCRHQYLPSFRTSILICRICTQSNRTIP